MTSKCYSRKSDFLQEVSVSRSVIENYVPPPIVLKSSSRSATFRSKGNKLFHDKRFSDAILLYNLSILSAEFAQDSETSVEAGLSLSNRAMCLFHLGLVGQAISDLEAADVVGYPDRHKLQKKRTLYQSQLTCKQHQKDSARADRKPADEPAYTVFQTQDAGRGLKASRDIKSGELILADHAFAAMLDAEHLDSFCYKCLKKIAHQQVFPCVSCTQVRYCSLTCSKTSFQSSHKYECRYLDLLNRSLSLNSSSKLLSMRIILSSHPKDVLNDEECISEENNLLLSKEYATLMKLVDHEKDCQTWDKDTAFLTAFIVHMHPGFQDLDEAQQLLLASRLQKHARQTKWNAMSVSHRSLTPSDFEPEVNNLREDVIGIGLFFTQLLINHSCDPNIQTCGFDGDTVFLQAIKDIREGDEILNSYGMFSKWQAFELRQSYLKENYRFSCLCSACSVEKEPLIRAYKCPAGNCNGPVVKDSCLLCNRVITLTEENKIKESVIQANQALSAGIKFLNEYLSEGEENGQKVALMEKIFWESFQKVRKNLYRDHRDVVMTMDTICSFYLRTGVSENSDRGLESAQRLLRDTKRVFDEDVHLFNTCVKVMESLKLFSGSGNNRKELEDVATNARLLVQKILPEKSEEATTLRTYLDSVLHEE